MVSTSAEASGKLLIAVPGERLGSTDHYQAGDGTYTRNGFIYSKLAGKVIINDGNGAAEKVENSKAETKENSSNETKRTIHVKLEEQKHFVPEINSVVTSKILSTNPRFCKLSILSVNGIAQKDTFHGILRKENVRATEIDKVDMYKSYRPGDIVLARVISLGDSQSYVLSTAENELGVIYARSEAGVSMVPRSWCAMQCPKTNLTEPRKVAKVKLVL